MRLFSYVKDEVFSIGAQTESGTFNLSKAFEIFQKAKGVKQAMPLDFLQVLVEMGYCSRRILEQVLDEPWVRSKESTLRIEDDITYDSPIARPSKIIGIGRNYQAHAQELGNKAPEEPLFFCKASTTLIPHEADIIIPDWVSDRVDHEAELGFIIGKMARNIPEEEAMDYVAGYTIVNDVTARTIQKSDQSDQKPWFRSKSIDTFCPTGPYIVPADDDIDPRNLDIRLTVNGEERQKANTSSMIFNIPQIIAYISQFMTLLPGDLIATGTPEGVGAVEHGDIIEIEIAGLGMLRNRVVRQ